MVSTKTQRPDIVFFAPTKNGGLYEHTRYQAQALAEKGYRVDVLTSYVSSEATKYRVVTNLMDSRPASYRVARFWYWMNSIQKNVQTAADYCNSERPLILYFETFIEYGAPFWFKKLSRLAASGIMIGANLHDPVRDFQIGPKWWHNLSVRSAYSSLSFVLAHQTIPPTAGVPDSIDVSIVPVGVYRPNSPKLPMEVARLRLGLPIDKKIFLFFGFIRDNKNLDVAIEALVSVPDAILVVAGRAQSSTNRPLSFYQELARRIGVSNQVRFDSEYISDEKLGEYFSACDLVMLTYSAEFLSQSGVLNIAVHYNKPCIASGGSSPLVSCVEKYHLGTVIAPNDKAALVNAFANTNIAVLPDWEGYERFATWETNIAPIAHRLDKLRENNATSI